MQWWGLDRRMTPTMHTAATRCKHIVVDRVSDSKIKIWYREHWMRTGWRRTENRPWIRERWVVCFSTFLFVVKEWCDSNDTMILSPLIISTIFAEDSCSQDTDAGKETYKKKRKRRRRARSGSDTNTSTRSNKKFSGRKRKEPTNDDSNGLLLLFVIIDDIFSCNIVAVLLLHYYNTLTTVWHNCCFVLFSSDLPIQHETEPTRKRVKKGGKKTESKSTDQMDGADDEEGLFSACNISSVLFVARYKLVTIWLLLHHSNNAETQIVTDI